jgi:hypothetical protein
VGAAIYGDALSAGSSLKSFWMVVLTGTAALGQLLDMSGSYRQFAKRMGR